MAFEDFPKKTITDISLDSEYYNRIRQVMASYADSIDAIVSEWNTKTNEMTTALSRSLGSFDGFGQTTAEQGLKLSDEINKRFTPLSDQIKESLSEFSEGFKKLDVNLNNYINNLNPILHNNCWFFTPSMEPYLWNDIISNINQQTDHKSFLNKVFVDYYSSNNFENLDNMIKDWDHNLLLTDRLPILNECLFLLKDSTHDKSNISNPHYLIIPTLIAQIDGLMTEYLIKKGFTFLKSKCKKTINDKLDTRDNNFDKCITEFIENNYNTKSSIQNFLRVESNAARDILLEILFQPASTENNNLKFPLSRHKIMHGQFLNYGNIEDTIRLFLLIDFLADSTAEDLRGSVP